MDGIIVIDKPKNITSRDVVNKVCKILNTKKVGHTGTLDPIATGVLVLCVEKATKLVDELTCNNKEYIATVKLGILTDTLDIDGDIIEEKKVKLDKDKLLEVLNSFIGVYNQEVPLYSAVKINGKKLYEYARNNQKVSLPKRNVQIYKIELLEFNDEYYKFKVLVSKGTYIRSLIKDINDKLNIIGVMSDLRRISQGKFSIINSYTLDDIESGNYKIIGIDEVLDKNEIVEIDDDLYKKVKNGAIISNIYKKDRIIFKYKNRIIAIYKIYDKNISMLKPYKMFI